MKSNYLLSLRKMNSKFILILIMGLLCGFNSCSNQLHKSHIATDSKDYILTTSLLNSERIQMKFGSYDLKVIKEDSTVRVSNLYSLEEGKKITRTFAVVQYPKTIDEAYLPEHLKIIKGRSIGQVFKEGNWIIDKEDLFVGEILPSINYSSIYTLMGNIITSDLAVYSYLFKIHKDGKSYTYATITEVYHPDYLKLNDLKKLYPEASFTLNENNNLLLKQVYKEMETTY